MTPLIEISSDGTCHEVSILNHIYLDQYLKKLEKKTKIGTNGPSRKAREATIVLDIERLAFRVPSSPINQASLSLFPSN
ncbi:hypothetical protein EAE99_000143 [Botrytis elliptica]|nr:hypothetical protein EAE99_000143 [Botrytis elliptica]